GTLQSVGQVVAGASLIDADTVKYAMLFKIARIIMLAVVVIVFERMTTKTPTKTKAKGNLRLPIPWYVLGFLTICILNSFLPLPSWL
ncbi:putative sulfate exporter family transporter, partial [Enterococcus faecalis]|nr:putative sulfate exporter family transporter [Enterococcus faecalis]